MKYVLRVSEAMERYGLSRTTLMQLARREGAIRKIGRAVRLDVATMDSAIDSMSVGGDVDDGQGVG